MVVLVAAQNLVTLFLGFELLSIPLYVLCATEMRRAHVARVGAEVPDHRLGRLGDAALRPGASSTARRARPTSPGSRRALGTGDAHRPAVAHRHGAGARRPGVQGLGRAVPPVDARRLRGRADADHGVHGGRDEGRGVRRDAALLRRRADRRRSRLGARRSPRWRRSRSSSATSARSGRRRSSGCSPGRASRRPATCSPASSSARELGRQATVFYLAVYLVMNVAAFAVIVARERETDLGDDIRGARGHRRAAPAARLADDDRDARAGRHPGDRRASSASST